MKKIALLSTLALISAPALAGPNPVPAPDTLALLAIGAVGAVAAWAGRRKKK
jgi:hypothetical protein